MIIYPDKPWADGQTFVHTTQEGGEIIGLYDAPTQTWLFRKGNSGTVYTNTVYTVDVRPAEASIANAAALFDDKLPVPLVDNLVTQQDVNWYLYELVSKVEGSSQVWIDENEPPIDDSGLPMFFFWYNPVEEEMYVWDAFNEEWKLTALMDFDRPPILSDSAPTEHPKFPGKPIQEGDFWFDQNRLELTVRYNGQWFPVSIPPDQIDMLNATLSGIEDNFTRVTC